MYLVRCKWMDPIRRRDRHGNGATTIIIYNRSGGDLHKRRQVGSIESRLAPIKSFSRLKIEKKTRRVAASRENRRRQGRVHVQVFLNGKHRESEDE